MKKLKELALLAAVALVSTAAIADPYTKLFRIMKPNGDCQVKKAGAETFEAAGAGKAYPFGSVVQCGADAAAILLFTDNDAVRILSNSSAEINIEENGSRVVKLQGGTVVTRIGANTTNDMVVIDTPIGRCRSIIGNCKVALSTTPASKTAGESYGVELRAEPMSQMKFVGEQYILPLLKNGFGASILSLADKSYTIVTDLLGDYPIYVNTGLDPDPTGPVDENPEIQPIKMSSKSALKIWREKAPIGGRTIVSVFATTPSGKGRESFAFAVGNANVASRSNVFFDPTATNEVAEISSHDAVDNDAGDFVGDDGFGNADDTAADGGDTEEGGAASAPAAQPTTDDEGLYDFLY